jgi:hypothetical protein
MLHRVPLRNGWELWRSVCLRATGFPAELVLELAASEAAAAVDRLLDQEAAVERAREEATRDREPRERRVLERTDGPLAAARARAEELARELDAHYLRAQHATSARLRGFTLDDRFRQALTWQNRAALRASVDSLSRRPIEATDSKTRKDQLAVASYVQRYCVKNDTIGFFGPVGWATIGDAPETLRMRPGADLLANRTVYYEYWAIAALAERLARDPALRPFLVPRRVPTCRIEGTTLFHSIGRSSELPAEFAAVATRCDGVRTAREIAREVGDEADVFELLDELVENQVITWTLEIPTAGAHPDHHLAAWLDRIEDVGARERARAALAELDRERARVANARDATELDAAVADFEARFTSVTDAGSQRAAGLAYAGRTPLFEDCRRDLEVELGRSWVERLAPLELLLQSARWFTHEIASRYRSELSAIYEQLRGDAQAIDFARFWQAVPRLFPGAGATGSIVGAVRDELRRRWSAILRVDPAETHARRSAAALAGEVAAAFRSPGPGWPAARHHSPDVMIAARGHEAFARGEYTIVLGELHVGFHTFAVPLFAKQHPAPDELIAARDADLDQIRIAPVWSKAVSRADYYSLSARDLDLEIGDTKSARPRSQVVVPAELVVTATSERLEVRTRDGSRRFDIIAFLEHHLIAESYAAWSLLPPAPRTPRISIDDLVVARATWRVDPGELAWPRLDTPVARFLGARRWARSLGMPRWLFVKTPEETKPVYVDLESTVFVELLAKHLRAASAASLSEMLPAVDETWVVDANGAAYTSELRLAVVDPEPWC